MTSPDVLVPLDASPGEGFPPPSDASPFNPVGDGCDRVVRCLTPCLSSGANLLHFQRGVQRAIALGARLFEVVLGAPADRYGARLTFSAGPDAAGVAGAFGLAAHPLGPPAWLGLRATHDGALRAKAYHRPDPAGDPWPLPHGYPKGLQPALMSDRKSVV